LKVAFRAPRDASDVKFVVESWLEGQRTSYSAGLVAIEDWFDVMRPQYTKLMRRPGMQTVVAYEKTDPDFLYGSIIADPTEQRVPDKSGSLHWWPALVLFVFVKQNYRREGIGRALFSAVGVDVTKPFLYACNTVTASRLASKAPLAKFNPLAARFPKNDNR
jgi:GNAT superfamily N-acetyltransferase